MALFLAVDAGASSPCSGSPRQPGSWSPSTGRRPLPLTRRDPDPRRRYQDQGRHLHRRRWAASDRGRGSGPGCQPGRGALSCRPRPAAALTGARTADDGSSSRRRQVGLATCSSRSVCSPLSQALKRAADVRSSDAISPQAAARLAERHHQAAGSRLRSIGRVGGARARGRPLPRPVRERLDRREPGLPVPGLAGSRLTSCPSQISGVDNPPDIRRLTPPLEEFLCVCASTTLARRGLEYADHARTSSSSQRHLGHGPERRAPVGLAAHRERREKRHPRGRRDGQRLLGGQPGRGRPGRVRRPERRPRLHAGGRRERCAGSTPFLRELLRVRADPMSLRAP